MPYIGNQHNVGDHVNNFKVLDDISSYTATFDGSATSVVSTTAETIRIPKHRFIQGQRVTYNNGGGSNIGGLTSGTAYYVSFDSANTIKLATSLANANSNTVINLSTVGGGTSHTLNAAFDGINTKFKLTFGSGNSARLNNATQINVAINNVIQRPNLDANNFSDGFALADNHKIVFKTAPTSQDIFWGSIIANTIENFDLRDNEVDNFTGNGSTTEFNLSTIPANNESIIVTIDGVLQHPSDKDTVRAYTLIDSILQFTAAPALNAEIQARHIGFAGASTADVSGFYGRTGNVVLGSTDHITTGDITSRNINASGIITAASANFGGNVSIGGTLTYEDVTNVDSVGILTARSGIHIDDSITHIGDTNTKIRFPSNNNISFETNGGERLRIKTDGTVYTVTENRRFGIGQDPDATTMGATSGTWQVPEVDGQTIGSELRIGDINTGSTAVIRLASYGAGNQGVGGGAIMFTNTRNGSASFHSDIAAIKGARESLGKGYLRFFTANQAANQERLRITSEGKVGIGITTPGSPLQIVNSSDASIRIYDSTGATGDLSSSGWKFRALAGNAATNANGLQISHGTTERIHITTSGYFGIGTNNPESPLVVRDANNTLGIFTSTDSGANIDLSDDDAQSRIRTVDGRLHLYSDFGSSVADSSIRFFIDGNNEKVRIASDGNVGIGSENPSKKLSIVSGNNLGISLINNTDFATAGVYFEGGRNTGTGIVGDLHFYNRRTTTTSNLQVNGDGDFTFNQNVGIGTNNPVRPLHIHAADCRIRLEDAGVATDVELQNVSGDAVLTTNGASNLRLQTNNTERLRILSDGKVGIGTQIPSAKLESYQSGTTGYLFRAMAALSVGNRSYDLKPPSSDSLTEPFSWNTPNAHAFQVDGNEALRIASDGKVGIGTDNPQQALHILRGEDNHLLYLQGGDTICDIVQSDNGGSTRLRSSNGYFYIWTGGDGNSSTGANGSPAFRLASNLEAKFYNSILVPDKIEHDQDSDTAIRFPAYDTVSVETGGSERLRITPTGNVGINSTSPAATLDIHDIGSTGPCLLLRGGSSTEGDIVVPHDEAMAFGHWNYSSSTFTERLRIDSSGDVFPGADNGQDLGTSSKRWANVYSADLQLSNKGKTNDVDGTWGDYTIQEGESDLFLINNRNGKKYKFNLTEVS